MENNNTFDEKAIITQLRDMYNTAYSYYAPEHERIRLLDLVDNGKLWQALDAKLPPYQICPDTNFISYVKSNIVASIYTVSKSAMVLATSDKDKDLIADINLALEQLWQTQDVGSLQCEAGEWAALTNLGITQVGWDENMILDSSEEHFTKGSVAFKNIEPIKFMRDPFAKDLKSAGYCMTYDVLHKSVFLNQAHYKEAFKEYIQDTNDFTPSFNIPTLKNAKPAQSAKNYFTLLVFWVKNDEGGIDEYHTVNLEKILYYKKNIKPNAFPFALLYCNKPRGGRPLGLSEPGKIFANSVAYNIMDSIQLTSEYRNQRPPKFVSSSAGLNVNSFAKHSDDPDYTFIVNGDATKAVHYHEYPQISNIAPHLQERTANAIKMVSGVDDRYTGRDTGSIITTGGTEEMLNRVTIIDTPKINNYEKYTKRLTELVLLNMIEFSPKRSYFIKNPDNPRDYKTVTVDFPNISSDTIFQYQILISSELPKNKQRIAATATALMEKQMQYGKAGMQVDLIKPEEWLEMQDLPFKERMLERMGIQRNTDAVEMTAAVLFGYSELVKQGMDPDKALMTIAKRMQDAQSGTQPLEQPAMPTGVPSEGMEAPMQGPPAF